MSIYSSKINNEKISKNLPTLKQFSEEYEGTKKRWLIKVLFYPGKFPNVSLFTEDFRIIVNSKTEFAEDLIEEFDNQVFPNNLAVMVYPDFEEPGSFTLERDTTTTSIWEPIKQMGWKVEYSKPIETKKTRTKKTKDSIIT